MDVKVQSQLIIMVKYWDAVLGELVVELLEFIICSDPSADGLSKSILTLLKKQRLPTDRYKLDCLTLFNIATNFFSYVGI